ncbi:MAG: aquaporin [Candidatus Nephthysia bennettiae]|uniref:Aquaporin family protein n=1 Tax=Candidatus Nephthysia bennettiae TaxID=3127016 RepID=A0A934N1E4_9BACT|nr:aquaporin family protein [Candidatus Dormibacteraeota bacterium]MBJ7610742.1 aquaporin family protein [Candidatus Dormibacteraeota bacterium]PZR97892.1 MAG: aquaporin [Candidatus Dormibacteraeota bacterium]
MPAGQLKSQVGANLLRTALAEAVGTFILVFPGTAVATAASLKLATAGPAYDSLAIALAFGLALAAVVTALGQVSGAHVNPAVTIGLASTGNFPWRYVPAYVVAQFLGAIAAALATWLAFGDRARTQAHLGATTPAATASLASAFAVEFLITFVLVFVIVAIVTDERVPASAAGPAIGFTLAIGVFVGGPVSGGAANPARALGPMLVATYFNGFWIYLLAPFLGGITASMLYQRLIGKAVMPEAAGRDPSG